MDDNNNYKIMLGELSGKVEMLCHRVENLENKIDKIERQISKLSNFDAKIVGASLAIATITSIVISYLR